MGAAGHGCPPRRRRRRLAVPACGSRPGEFGRRSPRVGTGGFPGGRPAPGVGSRRAPGAGSWGTSGGGGNGAPVGCGSRGSRRWKPAGFRAGGWGASGGWELGGSRWWERCLPGVGDGLPAARGRGPGAGVVLRVGVHVLDEPMR
ncbi:hypothetical protein SBD_3884 [Streptomyces bottropensis ATCC 25435]|uniref:Uncharacterized protein n=1 Tax=Streptomyces bottropensis ATCC 25435 TaxID=1054862 RepID=M3EDG3_9ACTN|nr:hypothetical protein SBD_3884 [Streptomyces bottropensis ATCC 25435]